MKIAAILLIILLFLSACSTGGNPDAQSSGLLSQKSTGSFVPGSEPQKYIPDHQLSMEETIENFFSLQYDIYTGMRYFDISCLMDISQQRLSNELVWLETLTLRRRLIAQNEFLLCGNAKIPIYYQV